MGQSTLNQISESLLQYQVGPEGIWCGMVVPDQIWTHHLLSLLSQQRNVGILEKIVHSLTQTNQRGASFQNRQELETQYQAQADVIDQLGNKVHNLISDQKKTERNPTIKTTLIKLERDFDRVQKQANLLQATVQKIKEQRAATKQEVSENTALEEYQKQMQVQMQEDVSQSVMKSDMVLLFCLWQSSHHWLLKYNFILSIAMSHSPIIMQQLAYENKKSFL